MRDAASQPLGVAAQFSEKPQELNEQLVEGVGAAIGQVPLHERPDAFVGIELRSVGGEVLEDSRGCRCRSLLKGSPLCV